MSSFVACHHFELPVVFSKDSALLCCQLLRVIEETHGLVLDASLAETLDAVGLESCRVARGNDEMPKIYKMMSWE